MERPVVLDVAVPSEDLSYSVHMGEGVLGGLGAEVKRSFDRARRVGLVSDANVMPLYGSRVKQSLEAQGFEVVAQVVPPGEATKTPARMIELVGAFVREGLSRTDAIVALGGGVVGDLAGLVASVIMRGIGFVQCPTSLLAQVDASVGGKVAVDLPEGKNLLGAFHFPRAVLIDPSVLTTLPDDELGCGLAEMLKHGALFSREHYDQLLASADAFYDRTASTVTPLIATSVALKAACVSRDPQETSRGAKGRVLLNLGHTIGHAIEAVSEFGVKHGHAVALGLVAAARVSERRRLARPGLEADLVAAVGRLRLSSDLNRWLDGERGAAVEQAMRHDKKRAGGTITYIALASIGEPRVVSLAPGEILALLRAENPP